MAEPIWQVGGKWSVSEDNGFLGTSTLTRLAHWILKLLAHIRTGTSGAERQEAFQQTWNFNFKALER